MYGTEVSVGDMMAMGRGMLSRERSFNRQAGMTAADDRLPEFFSKEALPPHGTVWDVPDAYLDEITV